MRRPLVDDVVRYGQTFRPPLPRKECEKFMDFYESKGWKVGKNPMVSWMGALRNWRRTWMENNVKLHVGKHAPTHAERTSQMLNQSGLNL